MNEEVQSSAYGLSFDLVYAVKDVKLGNSEEDKESKILKSVPLGVEANLAVILPDMPTNRYLH